MQFAHLTSRWTSVSLRQPSRSSSSPDVTRSSACTALMSSMLAALR